nr:MAG TPA: hypothetical protein [Caudoviricetes sp.]
MTEGSNGGRYACRHSNVQFPRKRGIGPTWILRTMGPSRTL